jgi:DNA invertase Pin-like site-specific DNA recombinase
VLVVAKLDRAFRNAADALATAEQLKAHRGLIHVGFMIT